MGPEYRRRGVGRAMLDRLAGEARERDLPILRLFTIRETGNVVFFERCGFRIVEESEPDWCTSDRFGIVHDVGMERLV